MDNTLDDDFDKEFDEIIKFLFERIDSKKYGFEKCRAWLNSKCYEDLGNGDVYENNDLIGYLLYLKADILEDLSALLRELVHIKEVDKFDKKIRLLIKLISEYEENNN